MKRLFTFAMTMLLGATMALAQTGGGAKKDELNPQPLPPGRKAEATKTSKAHKGGKKSKKGSSTTTTTTNPK